MGAAKAMTDSRLGPLGYGAAALGNLYQRLDEDCALRTLDAAWNGGIRYFDTAPHYGVGLSEKRLGRFLQGKNRSEYIVSTKVGRILKSNPYYKPGDRDTEGFDVEATHIRRWDFTEKGIRQSLSESLERLGLQSIDILYLHDPDAYDMDAAVAQALPALQRIKAEGLCRAIGIGSNSAEALATLISTADIDLIMLAGRYTLLEQTAASRLLPLCERRGIEVVTAAVFNSGILAKSSVPDDAKYNYEPAPKNILNRVRELAATCQAHGVELPSAALQYTLQHPTVNAVVMGARGEDQVNSNIANMNTHIPTSLWTDLEAAGLVP